ncbi:MAG: DNA polymerase III subunit delta' [Marinobacter sp.]|nr:DNA polymerase III subunit delta' [Marinobacter sp.]
MISDFSAMTWLQAPWQALMTLQQQGRLPHGLLLVAPAGIGKRQLAERLAARLLCDVASEGDHACGHCRQCELLKAESHPDVKVFQPESSKVIKVDQIRALSEFAVASPQVAKRKVIIVDRADQLNVNAANALLKTLEEPVAGVTLILLQEAGRTVLPTVRSRCQSIALPIPEEGEALNWLRQSCQTQGTDVDEASLHSALLLCGGAPGKALSWLDAAAVTARTEALAAFRSYLKNELVVGQAAAALRKSGELEQVLWTLELWALDAIRLNVGASARDQAAADVLGYLAAQNPAWRFHARLAQIRESRAGLSYNVSPDLEIERLLIAWKDLMPARQRRRAS